jgi:alpha-tubulin suppressor-like RCC1 family protein
LAQGGSIETNGQSLVLLATGALYAWGSDKNGQLGNLGSVTQPTPIMVTPPAGVSYTMLVTGGATSYGVTAAGAVYAWGAGLSAQIGNGLGVGSPVPVEVIASGVTLISSTANDVVTAAG